MIISIDVDKAFDKIQYPLGKCSVTLGIERNFLRLIKGICENSTAYNILKWGKD